MQISVQKTAVFWRKNSEISSNYPIFEAIKKPRGIHVFLKTHIYLMFGLLGFIPDGYPLTAVMLLTAIHGLMGANCGGFYKCGTLVAISLT